MNHTQSQPGPARESNIELMRIIFTIGVYVLHYNIGTLGGGMDYAQGFNRVLLYGLEAFFICAVDLFMLISGYYMAGRYRVNPWKYVRLLLMVAVFKALTCVLDQTLGLAQYSAGSFLKAIVPADVFINLYIATGLLAPFICYLADRISQRSFTILLAVCIVLIHVIPTVGHILTDVFQMELPLIYTVTMDGSASGYSLVNYVLMFVIGLWLRKYGRTYAGGLVLTAWLVNNLLIAWIALALKPAVGWGLALWSYDHVLVVNSAILTFLLFKQYTFYSRVINRLARSSLVMYLLHKEFFQFMNVQAYVTGHPVRMLVHIAGWGILIYGVCWIIHLLYQMSIGRMMKRLEERWPLSLQCEAAEE